MATLTMISHLSCLARRPQGAYPRPTFAAPVALAAPQLAAPATPALDVIALASPDVAIAPAAPSTAAVIGRCAPACGCVACADPYDAWSGNGRRTWECEAGAPDLTHADDSGAWLDAYVAAHVARCNEGSCLLPSLTRGRLYRAPGAVDHPRPQLRHLPASDGLIKRPIALDVAADGTRATLDARAVREALKGATPATSIGFDLPSGGRVVVTAKRVRAALDVARRMKGAIVTVEPLAGVMGGHALIVRWPSVGHMPGGFGMLRAWTPADAWIGSARTGGAKCDRAFALAAPPIEYRDAAE